ncbi:MAG: SNF2 helicase-associated domain-containing protein, partial [Prochlorococcaceae cyanobacterium]
MSLLHATWLFPAEGDALLPAAVTRSGRLLLWADTWRVATPASPAEMPPEHPLSLSAANLSAWLEELDLKPEGAFEATANLTLPSRRQAGKGRKSSEQQPWSGLPLQAGEPIPKTVEWWPWQVQGLALEPADAAAWLARLPLSGRHPHLADDLRWWSHVQRWVLSLIARGRWLPQLEALDPSNPAPAPPAAELDGHELPIPTARARWMPLLNREDDRRRLEELASRLPLVATCALPWREPPGRSGNRITRPRPEAARAANPLACRRPGAGRLRVARVLEELLDAQLRSDFSPEVGGLDPLLNAWQRALGPGDGLLALDGDDTERLSTATHHWRETVAGQVVPARACLELFTPAEGEELWELRISLQAEADPSLRLPAAAVWGAAETGLKLGEIDVAQPGELLLEGLGRALQVFEPIARGLDSATPETMQLAPAEAFVLVRTAAAQLRGVGVGVLLPASLSGGLASRLGLAIESELPARSRGFTLGENLDWSWQFMIGGVTLSLRDLERLSAKRSPLVLHKGVWIELRPSDLKNAERFCAADPALSLDDALRLTATDGDTLMRLPVHRFEAGPRLQAVLEQYHQQKAPDPLPAPEGFCGQLRPYQERGLGWLAFLHRFDQGACLADDMGLGKTIQLLAFLQHLKAEEELKRPVLLVAPTSVLTNWKREAAAFTPELVVKEHYGPRRPRHRTSQSDGRRSRRQGADRRWRRYGTFLDHRRLL